jgi:hypothetical protein
MANRLNVGKMETKANEARERGNKLFVTQDYKNCLKEYADALR